VQGIWGIVIHICNYSDVSFFVIRTLGDESCVNHLIFALNVTHLSNGGGGLHKFSHKSPVSALDRCRFKFFF